MNYSLAIPGFNGVGSCSWSGLDLQCPITVTSVSGYYTNPNIPGLGPINLSLNGCSIEFDSQDISPAQISFTQGQQNTSRTATLTFQAAPAGSSGSCQILYSDNLSNSLLTVYFGTQPWYQLTTSVSPAGTGNGRAQPRGGVYTAGTSVQVTAAPVSGYQFTGFSGYGPLRTANPQYCTMSGPQTVTAIFGPTFTISPIPSITVPAGTCRLP